MKKVIALVIVGVLATGVFYTWKQEQTLFKQSGLKFGSLKVHFFQHQLILKMSLNNQTDISMDIVGYDLQAYLDKDFIGSSKSSVTTHILPRSINPLPDIIINVQAGTILNDLMNTKVNSQVIITGTIYGQKYYIPFSYPVNYVAKLSDLVAMVL